MYAGQDFAPSQPGEDEIYTFDFANDLADSESLSDVTWTCAVVTGTDAAAASRVTGSSSISGTKSSQRVSGLLAGCRYRLTASALTTQGNTKILFSHVRCLSPD